jgi:hypothetical protein
MGMPINIKSLGFLNGMPEEVLDNLNATEYRDSLTTSIKLYGDNLNDIYEEVINRFMVWYPPQGYDTRGKKTTTHEGKPVIVLERYISCE